jgi:hypothetical protein
VVNSVPDATSASSSTARVVAPPLPMINCDVNERPAIVSKESATLHRRYHLESRAVAKPCLPPRTRQHQPIQRHRNAFSGQSQPLHQRGDRGVLADLDGLVVDSDDPGRRIGATPSSA